MADVPVKPRLAVAFQRFANRDYVVLTWEPGGPPALSLESGLELDDERKARVQAAIDALLVEVGVARKNGNGHNGH